VPAKAEMYFPYRQITSHAFFAPRDLVIRASVAPSSLVPAVRASIQAVDPNQPLSNIRTMDAVLGEHMHIRRMGMSMLAAFAALALFLATLGVYGVLSYFVAQHTQEIGVRLALGADARNVFAFVLKRGLRLAGLGVALGVMAAMALTGLLRSLLFEVSATDPWTYGVVACVLVSVAWVACALPARRAARVDPIVALRCE
jgi:putative ABC transport system permease protein